MPISASVYRPLLPQLALLAPMPLLTPAVSTPRTPIFQPGQTHRLHTFTPAHPHRELRGTGLLTRKPLNGKIAPSSFPAKSEKLPDPRYENYEDFLEDMPNHDWAGEGTLVVVTRHGQSIFNRLNKFFHGSMDSPLVDNGISQARQLGRLLRALPIRAIYSSPVPRARDTAEFIRQELELARPVAVDADLTEVSHGILDSYPKDMTPTEVDAFLKRMEDPAERARFGAGYDITPAEADYAIARVRARVALIRKYCAENGISEANAIRAAEEGTQRLDYTAPIDGESFLQGDARAMLIREFVESRESEPGAIVLTAHGMFDKILLMEMTGVDLTSRKQLSRIRQDNCCINVLWRKKGSNQWQLLVLNDSESPEEWD